MAREGITCPGCGVTLVSTNTKLDERFNASVACRELYYDLSYYTLALQDPYFIHQLIVDTYAAQHSGPHVKPITTAFALVGLYLVWERDFTGKQVQRVHMALANRSKEWPQFVAPGKRALLTVQNVVRSPDNKKPEMIKEWSKSVWDIWKAEEERVAELLHRYLGI